MRAARLLRLWVLVLMSAGIVLSWAGGPTLSQQIAGVVLSITVGLVLRLVANIGQLVYDLKAELITCRSLLEEHRERQRHSDPVQRAAASGPAPREPSGADVARLEDVVGRLQRLRRELDQVKACSGRLESETEGGGVSP